MIPALIHLRIHRIVEYIRSIGTPFTLDELEDLGVVGLLLEVFGIVVGLPPYEVALLEQDLHDLAETYEFRESMRKKRELFPEDRGRMLFREPARRYGERGACYPVPYSYPVDKNMRSIRPGKQAGLFNLSKRAPARTGGQEESQ